MAAHHPTQSISPLAFGDRFTMGPRHAAIACNEVLDLLHGGPQVLAKEVKRGRVHIATPGEPLGL